MRQRAAPAGCCCCAWYPRMARRPALCLLCSPLHADVPPRQQGVWHRRRRHRRELRGSGAGVSLRALLALLLHQHHPLFLPFLPVPFSDLPVLHCKGSCRASKSEYSVERVLSRVPFQCTTIGLQQLLPCPTHFPALLVATFLSRFAVSRERRLHDGAAGAAQLPAVQGEDRELCHPDVRVRAAAARRPQRRAAQWRPTPAANPAPHGSAACTRVRVEFCCLDHSSLFRLRARPPLWCALIFSPFASSTYQAAPAGRAAGTSAHAAAGRQVSRPAWHGSAVAAAIAACRSAALRSV